jgi:hypothetical protein
LFNLLQNVLEFALISLDPLAVGFNNFSRAALKLQMVFLKPTGLMKTVYAPM